MRRLATTWAFAAAIASTGANGQDATWLAAPGRHRASNTTTVALPSTTFIFPINPTTVGAFRFEANAPAYTFVPSAISFPPAVLRFTRAGIVNNSSAAPTFDNTSVVFANTLGAGNAIVRMAPAAPFLGPAERQPEEQCKSLQNGPFPTRSCCLA